MQERIQKLTNDVSERWKGFNKQQQRRLALGILGLIFAIGATIFITTRPRMMTLYANSDTATIVQMQAALQEAGIRYEVSNGGRNISVRAQDVDRAILEIEGRSNIFSQTGSSFTLDQMLENIGMGTPEATRQQLATRAQAGDIEIMLRGIQGVDDARVLLVPTDTTALFMRDVHVGSATVFLETSVSVDRQMAQNIANSVSTAVRGLEVDNITIIDQHARTLFEGGEVVDVAALALDAETQVRENLENTIRSHLGVMFDYVNVMANLSFNNDIRMQESLVRVNPVDPTSPTGLIDTEYIRTASATGTGIGNFEPGLGPNAGIPVAGMAGGGDTEASSEEIRRSYLYDEIREQVQMATGYFVPSESSISVIVHNRQYFYEADLAASGELDEMTWAEFRAANADHVPIDIDEALLTSLIMGSGVENLVLNGFMIPVFVDAVAQPVDWQNIILFGVLAAFIMMLAYSLVRRTQVEEVMEVEPELSVEDLLVTTRIEEQRIAQEAEEEAERQRLKDINYSTGSEVKEQIEKFVNEKPEAVAQLLRSWINDGWE